MRWQSCNTVPAPNIPQFDGLIKGTGYEQIRLGVEFARENEIGVPPELHERLPCLSAPQAQRLVVACRGDVRGGRRPRNVVDAPTVSEQAETGFETSRRPRSRTERGGSGGRPGQSLLALGRTRTRTRPRGGVTAVAAPVLAKVRKVLRDVPHLGGTVGGGGRANHRRRRRRLSRVGIERPTQPPRGRGRERDRRDGALVVSVEWEGHERPRRVIVVGGVDGLLVVLVVGRADIARGGSASPLAAGLTNAAAAARSTVRILKRNRRCLFDKCRDLGEVRRVSGRCRSRGC